jgi:hypothetical protein
MSQQNKTTLQSAINTQIADNTTGEISAADVRDNLINITDSLLFNNGDAQTIDASLIATNGVTGSLQGTATNAAYATNAGNAITADFVQIVAGQGVSINGMIVTANVRTVNGVEADGNGNIPLSLGTVVTGDSASLVVSSSGAITASIANATVWIISGDATPANNGDAYIFKSGSVGQWLTIAPLDQAAGDARYARKNLVAVQPLTSSNATLAATALTANTASYVVTAQTASYVLNAISSSFATVASQATTASYVTGSIYDSTNPALSSSYALTASYALTSAGGGGGSTFPYTGDAVITGTLSVSNGITGVVTSASNALVESANDSSTYNLLFTSVDSPYPLGDYARLKYSPSTNITYNPNSGLFTVLSIAQGASTTVPGIGAHAEGFVTQANGFYSHAEGSNTSTVGNYSHAEGTTTISTGEYSHAEGEAANSIAAASHAEGFSTKTLGTYSHAEGYFTTTSGSGAHAEGYYTIASGSYSHAEGHQAITTGSYSHAEGSGTITRGDYSHAEGRTNIALGNYSHAEGRNTHSSGSYSHAEGIATRAIGLYSHAEGESSIASGSNSHAEGQSTLAQGNYSHAEGYQTIAIGTNSHAEGHQTTASGQFSHTEGLGTFAFGNYSHAEGWGTQTNGQYQLAVGKFNGQDSTEGKFFIGNGTSNVARSTLFAAYNNNVDVTGVLNVDGAIASGLGTIVLPRLLDASYVDDATAAAAGIPVGGLYRNGSTIQIRLV